MKKAPRIAGWRGFLLELCRLSVFKNVGDVDGDFLDDDQLSVFDAVAEVVQIL
jgi:hypothetical protein